MPITGPASWAGPRVPSLRMRIENPLGVGLPIPPIQRTPPALPEPTPLPPAAPPPGRTTALAATREIETMLALQVQRFDPSTTVSSYAAAIYTSVSKLR